jgi:ABC-2 type transport system permease protein
MQVFRAYLKVLRASAGAIAMYMVIFIGIATVIWRASPSSVVAEFHETKTPVAVINRDGDAPLARGLVDHIADNFTVVPYPDDPERLQDALFYRNVYYVAIIPEGFSAAFMAASANQAGSSGQAVGTGQTGGTGQAGGNAEPVIQKVILPDSMSTHYVDMRIDKFLNAAGIYRDFGLRSQPNGTAEDRQAQIVAAVRRDLQAETPVILKAAGNAEENSVQESDEAYAAYCSFSSYALLATVILGISATMLAFNRRDLRLRNLCTPMPQRSLEARLAVGHCLFALGCWAILAVVSIALNGTEPFASGRGWLYLANSLAFTAVATSIGFAAGHFVKSSSAQSGVVNVVSLGMSFLGGAFVPQSFMSQKVLAFSRFLPSYWYVRAVDSIKALAGSASGDVQPIYGYMLIQLGFAAAIFSVTLLFAKERRMTEL